MRVRPTLTRATADLASAGVASPRTDVELLAAHVLGVPRGRLLLVDTFDAGQAERFADLIAARIARVPLQHLIGSVAFGDIDLAVGPGVFIPRPETELILAWALAVLPAHGPTVVDLCSGTGALALAIAHRRPDATAYAVELDPPALEWLRRNAGTRRAAGDTPVGIVPGDVTDPGLLATLHGTVDLVVCNPPYVPDGTPVPTEVSDFDPALAVFGGPDGLVVIRPVIARAAALLRPGGQVAIEHDDTHGDAVPDLLTASGRFTDVIARRDLAGRSRFATATRLAD